MSIVFYCGILILLIVILYFVLPGKSNSAVPENDAQRFAKLLISEIRLYETYKFERGLKNGNLYVSLRDEIEEARKKYEKRIANPEFSKIFDELLAAILADGDKNKLGPIRNM